MNDMKREIDLILTAVLRNRTDREEEALYQLLEEEIDWGFVAGQLAHHRLSGYFCSGLRQDQARKLFPEFKKTLELIVKAQRRQTQEINDIILPVLQELEQQHIRYAALKGLVFNATLYQMGDRRSNDSDLLVYEEDLDRLDTILRNFGYKQSLLPNNELIEASRKDKLIQRLNYHDLVPYVKKIDSDFVDFHEIDINFHFDSKYNDVTKLVLDYGTVHYQYGDRGFLGLPWETNLVHLCVHFFREGSNSLWSSGRRDVVLYKLIDIVNTIRSNTDTDKWNGWMTVIERLHLRKAAYYTLYHVNEFYRNLVPSGVLEQLKPFEADYIDEIMVSGKNQVVKRENSFHSMAFNLKFKMQEELK
ncbi:nucleotidyltransferase family protein [Paenibacillus ihuae]|uniref:nucleotidyltransferase family protein n=1 Tax=Paenibacillus ihuae TaxID=1232431 RepID=UPI0006D5A1D0|nr:nucleotidyltransferase family protein [Paenibacillus ihuae]